MENKTELLKTLIDELVGDVEFQDDKIIINIKKDANKVKINQLSDETFTSICEELGHDKVKELSDNEDYAKFIAQNSITLASMAKQTFGGQISDRDMQIMREQTAKMWESTPATMKRLEETLANQISILQGKIKGTPVGINIMTPEQQQQYIGLTKLYQAIMQGKKK